MNQLIVTTYFWTRKGDFLITDFPNKAKMVKNVARRKNCVTIDLSGGETIICNPEAKATVFRGY